MKNKSEAQALVLTLPNHEGRNIGFFHSGGSVIVKGWWERLNGSEGGMLKIDCSLGEVVDFDGGYDLPVYVRNELSQIGISCNF